MIKIVMCSMLLITANAEDASPRIYKQVVFDKDSTKELLFEQHFTIDELPPYVRIARVEGYVSCIANFDRQKHLENVSVISGTPQWAKTVANAIKQFDIGILPLHEKGPWTVFISAKCNWAGNIKFYLTPDSEMTTYLNKHPHE